MSRSIVRELVALLLLSAMAQAPRPVWAADRKPNIVFILADDLGFTDVACYGSRYYETPHIDKLAAQGLKFTDGYTCGPNCQPTRAALMSGQYGPRTGIYTVGSIDRFDWKSRPLRPVDNAQGLPLGKVTIAQTLQAAGYATGMFGKWHLGQQGDYHPRRRGFDEAIVSMGQHFDFTTAPEVTYPAGTYLADFLTDKAVDFITRHKDEPFFLYLPHFGVHSPYQAKKDLVKKFAEKAAAGGHHDPTYAAMLASVDESVGRVVKTLDELGLSDDTLVIFSSDNGGVGGYEREGIGKAGAVTDNAPLRGGKGMLYEGGIRAPYLFRWPGKIPAGTVCDRAINSVDLYPTLVELAEGKAPESDPLDGTSYLRLLTSGGQEPWEREDLYWHFPGYLGAGKGSWRTTPVGAIRSGDWKLVEFFETGKLELYNIRNDAGETSDLASAMPDRVKELHARMLAWRKRIHAPMPTSNQK
ncbi:sulfatase [Singulisphaera acidiphila]|uniref:Arylsulfatase A family protein n=1 Tax=Singulisphaera acidiphila (strain ATCC BAA-1392 / DSM 18658 / VKM B-2454 / MOB10) TaxID=886293 RepID=L0D900_SINAD|nr:sulfatase [Singulisphaera acidiphila]AGA25345.1 arylsulfatase A family protein [Singulisphaera acidiphila DSM 18658]